jgi:hypothetical protein
MLRAADEADTAARLRAALAREAQTQPESESDSDDDDDDGDEDDAGMRACRPHAAAAAAAAAMDEDAEEEEGGGVDPREHAECVAAFARVMRERFLSGKEDAAHVNYAAVDSDAALDERWAREAGQDAEDAYFGED